MNEWNFVSAIAFSFVAQILVGIIIPVFEFAHLLSTWAIEKCVEVRVASRYYDLILLINLNCIVVVIIGFHFFAWSIDSWHDFVSAVRITAATSWQISAQSMLAH